jgi:hypothetical protein
MSPINKPRNASAGNRDHDPHAGKALNPTGMMGVETEAVEVLFQHSNIPTFQYSSIPVFHHSNNLLLFCCWLERHV